MKYKNIKYGILLTREQLDFLKDDNQGFHRMKAFDTFLSLAAIEPFHYEKKNFSADLGIGQFAISKVELAELWHCDRKTAQKIIDLFNEVGILTSIANNRTTIHTIHCLAFWFVDGQDAPIKNPNYHRNTVTLKLADQGNANPTDSNDNDNIHPLSFTSSTPVPSMADANGRSSECHPSLLEDGRVATELDKVKDGGEVLEPIKVLRADIDYNKHMNNANYVRMAMELLPEDFVVSGLRVEYRVAAKLGDCLTPTIYQIAGGIIVSLSIGSEVSAIIEFT